MGIDVIGRGEGLVLQHLYAIVLGKEGRPVTEGLAVDVVDGKDNSVGPFGGVRLADGGVVAHEQACQLYVRCGKRPQEGLVVGVEAVGGDGIAADDVLAGGSGGYERLLRLHAGRGKGLHVLIDKRTDDGHDVVAVGQRGAERRELFSELIMPLYLQADGEGVVHLCLMEVLHEPLCRTFQTGFRCGIGQGSHHSHGLIHPMAGRHNLNGVVLLTAGNEE